MYSFPKMSLYLAFFLFERSHVLLNLVLKIFGSIISCNRGQYATNPSSTVDSIVSFLLSMHKDVKIWQIISSLKADVDSILQNIICLQSSEEISLTLEEGHKVQRAISQLNIISSTTEKGKKIYLFNGILFFYQYC